MNMIKLVVVIQVATVVATSCHNHRKGAFIPAGPEEDYNIITIARSPYDMHEFVIGKEGTLEHWPGCIFCDEQQEPSYGALARKTEQYLTPYTLKQIDYESKKTN